ncbi:MAG: succinyl-diaminopimelate desuccinylase, partial [Halobacteria archaeon]|nr:succinyl-diaminopimelate desuccinylase [Halobacteria archaeon]
MSDTDIVEFLEETVRIPSHENVEEIRDYLVENVEGAYKHGSGCVVAEKGEGSPHAVLNTHMDTVTPHVEYERDGDVIRGRGSCDAKASL